MWSITLMKATFLVNNIDCLEPALFMKFPPSSLDDLIVFSAFEKLTDQI